MNIKHIAAAAALAVVSTFGLGANAQAAEPAHAPATSFTVPSAALAAAPAGVSASASYGFLCWLLGHNWKYVRSWTDANGVRNSLYVCTRDGATKIIRLI